MKLVQLAGDAQSKAHRVIGDLGTRYASIGKIRSLVKVEISEEILQIDKIVRELLAKTGSVPNALGDFLGNPSQ